MKAERRHKLQNNTLAQIISDFPTYWKTHGLKIVLWGILGVALVVAAWYRFSSSGTVSDQAFQSLAALREKMGLLGFDPEDPSIQGLTQGQWQNDLSIADQIRTSLNQLKDEVGDDRVKAEALVALGNLNWEMANFPIISAANPNAVDYSPDRASLLEQGRSAYQQVVDKYSEQPMSVVSARFGLAAIAESSAEGKAPDLKTAQMQYDTITKTANVDPLMKQRAEGQLRSLTMMDKPFYIGTVSAELEMPKEPNEPKEPFNIYDMTPAYGVSTTTGTTGRIPSTALFMTTMPTTNVVPSTIPLSLVPLVPLPALPPSTMVTIPYSPPTPATATTAP